VLLIPVLFLTGCNKGTPAAEVNTGDNNRVIFWGEGCSHCEVVEEYLKENDPENRLELEKMEVFTNKSAQGVYIEKSKACGKNSKSISVPMMYWEGECFSGDTPIIDFLKEK